MSYNWLNFCSSLYILDLFREHFNGINDDICSEYTVKQQNDGAKTTVMVKQTKKKNTKMRMLNGENAVETCILRTHFIATHTITRTVKRQH